MELAQLKKHLKNDLSGLPVLSVAILGDHPTQLLHTAIKGYGAMEGYNLEIYEAEYNQIQSQIANPQSDLYSRKPKFITIFQSPRKLLEEFQLAPLNQRHEFAQRHLEKIEDYLESLKKPSNSNLIYSNFPELDENVFGNFGNKEERSFIYQLRKINFGLMNLALRHQNLFINDLALLQNRLGAKELFSPSLYATTGMIFRVDALPAIAKNTLDIIKAINGKIRKCLILDLDNTCWGGIIGDDGIEGIQIGNLGLGETFSRIQHWAKELKDRGIILAICSKNDEKTAMEPFLKHPAMVLRMEDIAVFIANWENKVDNIRHIQSILNVGYDSMVFIDDNPAERRVVRENLPYVTVPELPADPAEYLAYLSELNLFETATFTNEDVGRTKKYQEEAIRLTAKQSFVNEEAFLSSLKMTCQVQHFETGDIPRLAQLTQRSNQFNLRTIRYTEEEIINISHDRNYLTLSFKLGDTFGDYGLVSIIILKALSTSELLIDTWIMSCRVLKRGLEQLVLNEIATLAARNEYVSIIGEYLPTPKNNMVKDHYTKLGFKPSGTPNRYYLSVKDFVPKSHLIEKI